MDINPVEAFSLKALDQGCAQDPCPCPCPHPHYSAWGWGLVLGSRSPTPIPFLCDIPRPRGILWDFRGIAPSRGGNPANLWHFDTFFN